MEEARHRARGAMRALWSASAGVERAAEVTQEIPSGPRRPVATLALTLGITLDHQLLAPRWLGLTGLVDEVQKGLHSVGIGHGQ